jgi:hypothetical protein
MVPFRRLHGLGKYAAAAREGLREWLQDRLRDSSSSRLDGLRKKAAEELRAARRAKTPLDKLIHEGKARDLRERVQEEETLTGRVRRRAKSVRPGTEPEADPDDILLNLPACVHLDGEWMAIIPTEQGVIKYAIRAEEPGGALRPLTKDEEIALGIAPASRGVRAAAAKQLNLFGGELRLVLEPRLWQTGDLLIVARQLEVWSED